MLWQRFDDRFYLFHRRLPAVVMGTIDSVGRAMTRRNGSPEAPRPGDIRSILISRPDHLGDVVMTTAILPALKRAFPRARIDMLIGSWAKELVEICPLIDRHILFDHFFLNRQNGSLPAKCLKSLCQLPGVVRKLRRRRYDLGLELRPFWGNTIPLMYLANVRYRAGFPTAGFGFLLHKAGGFSTSRHFVSNIEQLLADLNIEIDRQDIRPHIEVSSKTRSRFEKTLSRHGLTPGDRLVIFHPGSGRKKALWSLEKWARLADLLQERNDVRVLIAVGPGESQVARNIAVLMGRQPLILANEISIPDFVGLVSMAHLLIGLESFSAHVAAAVDTPCVVIHSGVQAMELWRPQGLSIHTLTNPVSCSPCWRTRGCDTMECLQGVEVRDVFDAAEAFLR